MSARVKYAIMKTILPALCALLVVATSASAQTPLVVPPPPAPAPTPAVVAGETPVDRVVAVVGNRPILWSNVLEYVAQRRQQGMRLPSDSAGQAELARRIVNELIDEEVLYLSAVAAKIEVADADVTQSVDEQMKRIRESVGNEVEFRAALRRDGFGTVEDYRRWLMEQARRSAMQQRALEKLRQDGKLIAVSVSDADIAAMFEENRATLPRRPATVTFRQIVVQPRASEKAKAAARAKAESLLVELRTGGDFEMIAKRESMDPSNRETGGDLGWNRRGFMVPEFDRWMFALPPGQLSPVVETSFGYHIIRVDRVQPAEVKARHILIRAAIDSVDIARARAEADSVARAWRAGAEFDALVTAHHDDAEYKIFADPFPRDSLPAAYSTAFEGLGVNAITDPFPLANPRAGVPKFAVAQLTSVLEGGDYTVEDVRSSIRDRLARERAMRRLLDGLRKRTYIAVRL